MNEEAYLEALYADPSDDAVRAQYGEWLAAADPDRAAYFRLEEQWHRAESVQPARETLLRARDRLDPYWVAQVSRAPLGLLRSGLTFAGGGPRNMRSNLEKIERRWKRKLPADYASFLLRYNGGVPSKPLLSSNGRIGHEIEEFHDRAAFFSTRDRNPAGKPYLLCNVLELHEDQIDDPEDDDQQRFATMIPIGTLTGEDGVRFIGLAMDPEEFEEIVVVEYSEGAFNNDNEANNQTSFSGLLFALSDGLN
jgi:SMI1/KNR4 family protein SUKH-1